jgi:hypothetical protein
MYVYIKTESQLWTVGSYTPTGKWEAESDHSSQEEAAARVHYLNGGNAVDAKLRRVLQFLAHNLALHSYWLGRLNGEIKESQPEAQAAEEEGYQQELDALLR